ncbi:hypothetical protein SANA_27410 [Gottschalkiaceae bacterium SANA]|nr:hypothetical protein SANA_27410 [Gottschalkiaceae bacterium SANA]
MNWIQGQFHKLDQYIIHKNQWIHIKVAPSFYGVPRLYTGKTIEFDSTIIRNGDLIVELHLDNQKLLEEGLTMPQLFRKIKKEIEALEVALPDLYPEAKGCYGVSVFGSLLGRLGFETRPLPNRLSFFMIGLWENGIRWVHGSALKWHSPSVLFLESRPRKDI